ncbi:MAG TPA: class I SAM-dependent methyltransferase [Burkholderiales bacterium]|nr:class I SAM-dependent methyltransferase [Burkholderiales bacterium]
MKTKQELKSLHGKDYADKFEKTNSFLRLERLFEYIELDKDKNVVDFACGSGALMLHVAPKVKSYTGVDFSRYFIDRAVAKKNDFGFDNAYFECSSIQDFCKKHPDTFDIGFAMDFSEHVYDKEWLDTLGSIRNSLTCHGRLYLHTPNARFFLEVMKNNDFFVRQFPQHIAVRTPEENVTLLKKAGFRVHKMFLLPHYNALRFLHILSFLPFVGRYFKARIFIEARK